MLCTDAGRAHALARLTGTWHTRIQQPTLDSLRRRRDELVHALNDPNLTADDAERLAREAEDVRRALTAHQARSSLLDADSGSVVGRSGLSPSAPIGASTTTLPRTMSSAARTFVESPALADLRARGYKGTAAIETRALIDNAPTSGGAFQNPSRPADVPTATADRPLRLADLIDRRPTDQNTVEYVRDDSAAGAAAEVAEGALKPEASFSFAVQTDAVRTIATWVNMTRQSAEDNALLAAYIEGRLAYQVERRLDSQILNGDGVAPNLRGILATSGIGTYVAGAGEAAVLSLRRAVTVGQVSEYAPDTVVMHPADWERVELSTDSQGTFRVSPSVSNALAPRLWGLNVVPTTALAAGTALVGSFRQGATLWEREGVRVLLTDSHASNFTSNVLTLLAEMRVALSVWRPKAFVKVTLDPAGA